MQMRVRIDEDGETQLEKLEKSVVRTFNARDNSTPIYKIALKEVFNHLAKCHSAPKRKKKSNLPSGIFPETLEYTKGFLIARMPGLYADMIGGWPRSTHKFLIDENLPSSLGVDLWDSFGRATHTNFENLNGEKDKRVWEWAKGNEVSAIITRDRRMSDLGDLGLIAVKHAHDLLRKRKKHDHPIQMPNLPLIIQIDSRSKKSVHTLMKLHKSEISAHLERRNTPYIFLTDEKCITGPSYDDVGKYNWETIKYMASDIIEKSKKKNYSSASPS